MKDQVIQWSLNCNRTRLNNNRLFSKEYTCLHFHGMQIKPKSTYWPRKCTVHRVKLCQIACRNIIETGKVTFFKSCQCFITCLNAWQFRMFGKQQRVCSFIILIAVLGNGCGIYVANVYFDCHIRTLETSQSFKEGWFMTDGDIFQSHPQLHINRKKSSIQNPHRPLIPICVTARHLKRNRHGSIQSRGNTSRWKPTIG